VTAALALICLIFFPPTHHAPAAWGCPAVTGSVHCMPSPIHHAPAAWHPHRAR
jgi:hypothetical protein